jgi:hypothetical protein
MYCFVIDRYTARRVKMKETGGLLKGLAVSALFFSVFFSCIPELNPELETAEAAPQEFPVSPSGAAENPAVLPTGRAILFRGNAWGSGVPGFGENVFSAISGEYRLEGAAFGDGTAVLPLWVSREPLFFSAEWTPVPEISGYEARRRAWEEGFLLALSIDSGAARGRWIAVFKFSSGESQAGRFAAAWADRFLYFLYLAKSAGEVSLPAVVTFPDPQ